MKKVLFTSVLTFSVLFALLFTSPSCDEILDALDSVENSENLLGWLSTKVSSDTTNTEKDISFGVNNNNLPSSVDLKDYFPPIGNQGAYGTCVAWATGYNLKTFLEAKDHNYATHELQSPDKQFSPKYLFWAIPNSDKGENCGGTGFEVALDVMIQKGIPPLSEVPYEDLGDCSSATLSSWDSEAAPYKIKNYRRIDYNIDNVKSYLAQERAVVIGAKLGDNFMSWNSSSVIYSDTYLNPGMQHAYHAMILSGYDDNKGMNGAFRVVNSWGEGWGDDGYIWVDYNFFQSEFCFAAYVATNELSNPDDDDDNNVDPNNIQDGYDLVAWELDDQYDPTEYADYTGPRNRFISYNVYNSGDQTIYKEQDWNIIYLYYNAYDANDYGLLIYDYYTDDYGDDDDHNGDIDDDSGYGMAGNWWNYVDVESGQSVVHALYGDSYEYPFEFYYLMPENVNGWYYLLLVADGFDVIDEAVETNNKFWFTFDEPVYIENGIIDESTVISKRRKPLAQKPQRFAASLSPTPVSDRNVNTYTPEEIMKLIKHRKQSGALEQKVKQFKSRHKNDPRGKRQRKK